MSILKKKENINKKKIIIIAAAVIVMAAAATAGIILSKAHHQDEPSLSEIIEDKFSAYETDLLDSLASMKTNDDVAAYLMNWAKNKNISAVKDNSGNVIYSIKAVKGHEDLSPVVILCGYDSENMDDYTESMAAALTAAKNGQQNCAYKVIFCPESNGEKVGAAGLSSVFFTDDTQVFYLGKSGNSKVSQVTGGLREYLLSDEISYTAPSYDKAYKISIKNVPSELMGSKMGSKPNAIKTLGNILANFKSTSLLFEISSFYGGNSAELIPSSAGMTLVINSSDSAKFETKMNSAVEKFMDKYSEAYPDIEYTFEETDMPKKVFTKEETDNLVSLMYTALNGVYNKDDSGNVVAVTNIGKISTKDSMLKINVAAMSFSQEYLDEITESYRTISGLCNVDFDCIEELEIYSGEDAGRNAEFLQSFEGAFLDYTRDLEMKVESSVEFTPLTLLAEKNDNMSMMYLGVTENTKEKFAGALVTYLDKGIPEENEE